jgi:hypothetical protein
MHRQKVNRTFDEVVEPVGGLCDCLLTPKAGVNLEAGKALLLRNIAEAQAQLTAAGDTEGNNQ